MLLSNIGLKTKRQKELLAFQKKVGLKFKNLSLLELAFHHSSFSNENSNFSPNNERLEFLGDSVLGLIVSSFIYRSYPEKKEGDLAKIKSVAVSEDSLATIAARLEVNKLLILGKGEEMSGGRNKKAILADAMEAVIGAVYLDAGLKCAQKFVLSLLSEYIGELEQNKIVNDYKTALQEIFYKKFKKFPHYELKKVSGPEHEKVFWFSITVNKDKEEKKYGPCSGKTKKEAEQAVAKLVYEDLTKT